MKPFKFNQSGTRNPRFSYLLLTVQSAGRLNKALNRICTGAMSRTITPLPSQCNTWPVEGGGVHDDGHMQSVTVLPSVMRLQYLILQRACCWCKLFALSCAVLQIAIILIIIFITSQFLSRCHCPKCECMITFLHVFLSQEKRNVGMVMLISDFCCTLT